MTNDHWQVQRSSNGTWTRSFTFEVCDRRRKSSFIDPKRPGTCYLSFSSGQDILAIRQREALSIKRHKLIGTGQLERDLTRFIIPWMLWWSSGLDDHAKTVFKEAPSLTGWRMNINKPKLLNGGAFARDSSASLMKPVIYVYPRPSFDWLPNFAVLKHRDDDVFPSWLCSSLRIPGIKEMDNIRNFNFNEFLKAHSLRGSW